MKKTAILLSSIILSVTLASQALAADWENHWAADYISAARNAGWADMREKNNFEPDAYATREEVIYMLYASQLNSTTVLFLDMSDDLSGFTDVGSIDPKYLNAFKVLSANSLISGYADNTLKPKANITRAEMASLVSFLIPSTILSKDYYGYSDTLPDWAKTHIERCSRAGIISGYSDNTFRASNNVTRAEAVCMIQNLCDFIATVELPPEQSTTVQKTTVTETTTEAATETTEETTESTTEENTEETTADEHENDMTRVKELVQLINNERADEGSNELTLDENLCALAFLKAKDMYINNDDQKYTSTFGNLDDRLNEAGIKFLQSEMLLAIKVTQPIDVIAIFESSTDTRDLYLQSGYTNVGVGIYENRWAVIYTRALGAI